MSPTVLRNVAIVLVLAAVVAFAPGGGTTGGLIIQAASLLMLAAFAWFLSTMYRQHRVTLYSLGDGKRATLYGAAGVGVLTLSATSRLWNVGTAGVLVWVALVAGAVYAAGTILWSARSY